MRSLRSSARFRPYKESRLAFRDLDIETHGSIFLPRLPIVQNIKLPESLLSDDVSDNLQRYLGSRVLLGRKTPSTILKIK